jgi:1,4-alpha-glucan branching enzyme
MNLGIFPNGTGGWNARVWAPNATNVAVTSPVLAAAVGLGAAVPGFWEGPVAGLGAGDPYELQLTRGDGTLLTRLDPAARDTNNSSVDNWNNMSRVVDPGDPAHPWSPFTTPNFDDLILYQCHVGSFAGYRDALVAPGQVGSFDLLRTKLQYIRDLGFNALALLPVQEFRGGRSWGYNPAFYFALESDYGRPADLRALVDACHAIGMSVIFDVVYNHISDDDSSFYHFDEKADGTGDSYLSSYRTPWGWAPAFWQQGIREFFRANMAMYLAEYRGDGLRFDSTRQMEAARGLGNDGWSFMQFLTSEAKRLFPGKYLVAEHVPDHDSIVTSAGFHATWASGPFGWTLDALNGSDPVGNIERAMSNHFGQGQSYPYSWNTVKYLLGSHDQCGDGNNGNDGKRYFVERFGGRSNWYARAKARMAWALNAAAMGTPMMFMGNECHLDGYWHDGRDTNGDHRFDWSIAGDWMGMGMRYLVKAANETRWNHVALRNGSFQVTHRDPNGVIAFKRWNDAGDVVLVVVNATDRSYTGASYGVSTGQAGRWDQILCTQDAWFGGWNGAGNAYDQPYTQGDGKVYVNVPQWSVLMFRLL